MVEAFEEINTLMVSTCLAGREELVPLADAK